MKYQEKDNQPIQVAKHSQRIYTFIHNNNFSIFRCILNVIKIIIMNKSKDTQGMAGYLDWLVGFFLDFEQKRIDHSNVTSYEEFRHERAYDVLRDHLLKYTIILMHS